MTLPLPKQFPENGFYYHYKHDPQGPINNCVYEVLGIGFHTDTEPDSNEAHFVIYRALHEDFILKDTQSLKTPCYYTRPLKIWNENVNKNNAIIPRFKKITDLSVIKELQKIKKLLYPDRT